MITILVVQTRELVYMYQLHLVVNLDGSGGSSDTLEATRHESNVMQHGYWDESELDRKKEARERSEVDVRTALWTTGSWKRRVYNIFECLHACLSSDVLNLLFVFLQFFIL